MMRSLKLELEQLLDAAVRAWGIEDVPAVLNACRAASHGDMTTNLAFILASRLKRSPQEIAQAWVPVLAQHPAVASVEPVGGYLNIRLNPRLKLDCLHRVSAEGASVLIHQVHSAPRRLVEFVSANPTGPLHVGHGRQAAVADALVFMMRQCGYEVDTEYYINDAGFQMDVLVASVWFRIAHQQAVVEAYPKGLYQGEYLLPLADAVAQSHGITVDQDVWQSYLATLADPVRQGMLLGYPDEATEIESVKAWVFYVKQCLGARYEAVLSDILSAMMEGIQSELAQLGVVMGRYYSERALVTRGCVDEVLAHLEAKGYTYREGGALWFAATRFGDDKDRVLVRSNGERTYFTNDIAYHWDKVQRGYGCLINFLGSDHHGYVQRLTSALKAMDVTVPLTVRLVQFVSLVRRGVRVAMSTRKATFETLSDVIDECGVDATRFFYTEKHIDQPLDFDLELAVTRHQDNPVYYVQYAHARMCRLLDRAGPWDRDSEALMGEEEAELWEALMRFDETMHRCVDQLDPSFMATYLLDLAKKVHSYYAHVPVLSSEGALRQGRMMLLDSVRQVLALGLHSLGVSAPEQM